MRWIAFFTGLAVCGWVWGSDLAHVEKATVLLAIADKDGEFVGHGTGFLITDQGHFVTNEHVIDGAEKIAVFGVGIPKGVLARVIWADKKLDLAIVKTEEDVSSIGPITLFSRAPPQAIDVYAYGYPGTQFEHMRIFSEVSLEGPPTTTKGIISRTFKGSEKGLLIQHSSEIRRGNSGGPLVNKCGHVVGINTFGWSADEEGQDYFAVSSTELIEKIGSRIPGMGFSDQCDNGIAEGRSSATASEAIVSDIPSDIDSKTFFVAIALLASLAVIVVSIQRSHEKHARVAGVTSVNEPPRTASDGASVLLQLSGFDQYGKPLSLSVTEGSVLEKRGYVLGRSLSFSDLAINHKRLSRAHVWITRDRGQVLAADLNSTNGTYLNGRRLRSFETAQISPGDELRLADIVLAVSK